MSGDALTTSVRHAACSPGVRRAIGWNAALWMAGHTLTSGAFLSYFAYDLGASAVVLAWLAAAPELVGSSGLASRVLWNWCGNRRVTWLIATLLARVFTLLIPFAGSPWLTPFHVDPTVWLLLWVLLSQTFQGIATTLYFAWLSDLTDAAGWGPLFAQRNVVSLVVQMTVPIAGAILRDYWKRTLDPLDVWQAYAGVFSLGVLLLLSSIVPMWRVPDPCTSPSGHTSAPRSTVGQLLGDRRIRAVLAHSWCLAVANGLTQAAFFKYQIGVVHLSLTGYFLLVDVMLALQVLGSLLAGRCRTAADHRRMLFWGALIASAALPFWVLASAEQWWWLIGAFACWGAFGAVNVAGPNVMLGFSSRGETVAHLALFRQVAGTLAGLSGIVGGWWLERGLSQVTAAGGNALWAYWVLFGLSFVGRVCAAWLVLRIPLPERQAPEATQTSRGRSEVV